MAIELSRKILKMHAALSGLKNSDLSKVKSHITFADGYIYASIDFNEGSNQIDLENAATLLISNIASIKDHLKEWCKSQGAKFDGENLINTNKSVGIVHDLWNIDKHGTLDRLPRSGYTPELSEISTQLSISSGTEAGGFAVFTMNPRTGKMSTSTSNGGTIELLLIARVTDEHGNYLGEFSQICNEAAEAWLSACTAAGVALT